MGNKKNKKHQNCDCKEFIFINNELVCKVCKRPMKSLQKPITSKGLRYKNK